MNEVTLSTVWLLDVDGVVNVSRPGWGAPPHHGTAYSAGQEFRLRWAPALVSRIRALYDSGTVDVRWCSTWCSDADQVERLLGLPRLGRAWHHPISAAAAPAAKLVAALAVLDYGDRLIWTDDDAIPMSGPDHDKLTAGGRALLIAPVPTRGLQPEHLDAINAFIADTTAITGQDVVREEALRAARTFLDGTSPSATES